MAKFTGWIVTGRVGRCPKCDATDWLSNLKRDGCAICGLKIKEAK